MALAAGDRVYLEVNGGLMSDPPLFGGVDYTNGLDPANVLRVTWENGAQVYFSTLDQAINKLVVVGPDAAQDEWVGKAKVVFKQNGIIVHTFMREPSGVNQRYGLIAVFRDSYQRRPEDPARQVLWAIALL